MVDAVDYERFAQWRWCLMRGGYAIRQIRPENRKATTVLLHRQILGLLPGDGLIGDHVNLDRLDNRRENLRVVDPGGSSQNTPSRKGASSRFRGVGWQRNTQRWRAGVGLDGGWHALGTFDNELDAALAAEAFRREHLPFAQPDPALVAALAEREAARAV